MIYGRKMKQQFSYISLLLGAIVLLQFGFTPFSSTHTGEYISDKSSSQNETNKQNLIVYGSKASFITTVFSYNDLLLDMVRYYEISKTMQAYRQMSGFTIDILSVLLAAYGLFILYKRCSIPRTVKHISVLAMSRGGHAPPQICMN